MTQYKQYVAQIAYETITFCKQNKLNRIISYSRKNFNLSHNTTYTRILKKNRVARSTHENADTHPRTHKGLYM